MYEHGMALTQVVGERLDEARVVLEAALAKLPVTPATARPRAMILAQLGWVASKQGRASDALDAVAAARALLPPPHPGVLDAVAADALARVWKWQEALVPARAAVAKAPLNAAAWATLARILASGGDDRAALAAARKGLALSPRDPDLLRSQATCLRSLGAEALAEQALAAYDRFRAPDELAALRIRCAGQSERCAREREAGHTHVLHPR